MEKLVFQAYLRPARFFERIKYVTQLVVKRHTMARRKIPAAETQLIQAGYRDPRGLRVYDCEIIMASKSHNTALRFYYVGTSDSTATELTGAPSTEEIEAFVARTARDADIRSETAKRSARVPAKLRDELTTTKKARSTLRLLAARHSRTVWEGLKGRTTETDAARQLVHTLELIEGASLRLSATQAKIDAIKAGGDPVEDAADAEEEQPELDDEEAEAEDEM